MTNGEHVIETLILGMRDGKDALEVVQEPSVQDNLHMFGDVILNEGEAVRIACHVVYSLYEGKFPVDHLEVGDICIDAFQTSPCIITNINDRSIHVLYFNGKTHKFKKSQERYFKKLGPNLKEQLALFMDDCQLFAKSSMEIKSPSEFLLAKFKKVQHEVDEDPDVVEDSQF